MQVVTVLEGNLGLVGDDLILSSTLEEQDVSQRNASELFQACAGLDRVIQVIFLLVDEHFNRLRTHDISYR